MFMQPSSYLKLFPCPDQPGSCLLYSTKRTSLVRISEPVARAALWGKLSPESEKTLADLGMMVPSAAAEREEMRGVLDRINAVNRRISVTAILNFDCNLACVYCFEGRMKGRHAMSPDTADLLVAFIAQRLKPGKTRLDVTFYGGEPLLSPALLQDLSRRLADVCGERDAAFRFTLVTNGTLLTRRIVEDLLPLGLRGAKVTLDGPRVEHDRSRPFRGGAGSWDVIVANLREVCGLVPVQVGGNFTRESYPVFPRLLDDLTREGIGPDRLALVKFDPVTRPAANAGLLDFSAGCCSTDEVWLGEATLFLREEILKRGYRTTRLRATPCVVELDDEFTVNWDGSIYKCPAFIGWTDLQIGTLAGGVREYGESHKLGSWNRPECLACPYLPLCFGGCRYLQLVRRGSIDGVDCHRTYLDAILEGILNQDLRYHLVPGGHTGHDPLPPP